MSDEKGRSHKKRKKTVFSVYISKVLLYLSIALVVSVAAIIIAMPKAVEFVHKVEAEFPKMSSDIVIGETLTADAEAEYGDLVAVMTCEAFGLNCNVYQGSNRTSMRYGAGRVNGNIHFGKNGVVTVNGYGLTKLAPLHYAKRGDVITVKTADNEYKYQVYDTKYLDNNECVKTEAGNDEILVIRASESSFSDHGYESFLVFARCLNGEGD